MLYFDLDRIMIDENSFGSMLPRNWEEIANSLNVEIMDRIATTPDCSPEEAYDIAAAVWEDYCNGDLLDVPAAEEEEETMKKGWNIELVLDGEIRDYSEFNQLYHFETGNDAYADSQDAFDHAVSEGWITYENGKTLLWVEDM